MDKSAKYKARNMIFHSKAIEVNTLIFGLLYFVPNIRVNSINFF